MQIMDIIELRAEAGADGKNYFFKANDLYNWMSKPVVYGKPNISSSDFSKFAGNKEVFIIQAV